MPLPSFPAPPANLTFGLDKQLGTNPQKQRGAKKRKRDIKRAAAKETNKQNAAIIKKLKLAPKVEEPVTPVTMKQDAMEIDEHEEPSEEMVKLHALEKKSEELQGFLNQLQDAVAIGMFQLNELKKQIATATEALAAGEK
ncbi:hypothetical protein F5B17DRAFT_154072 [Nemania serpens]|nr:hypothetical protein F5B17DRAFT_154072 [Nemania serpens]